MSSVHRFAVLATAATIVGASVLLLAGLGAGAAAPSAAAGGGSRMTPLATPTFSFATPSCWISATIGQTPMTATPDEPMVLTTHVVVSPRSAPGCAAHPGFLYFGLPPRMAPANAPSFTSVPVVQGLFHVTVVVVVPGGQAVASMTLVVGGAS